MWAAYLLGLENILMAFLTEPELAVTVMDKVLACNMGIVRNAIIACGPDGLNPIEPVAGMTLSETRRRVGPTLCLCGNIDCGELLCHGTPEQVRMAVQQAVRDGGANGAFILTSSNSIHSSCDPRNVKAMIDAAKEMVSP